MKTFFDIIVAFSPLWLTVLAVLAVIHSDKRQYNKIKFKEFKKFYELNPDRWRCDTDHVYCQIGKDYDCEVFMFSIIDECKYRLWRRNRDKINMNKTHAEATQRMLDAVKEDIAKAKEKETTHSVSAFLQLLKDTNIESELPSLVELLKKYEEQ